ncbi:MAG: outer membrane beta-barrel protein [Bacteroidetes bacterium]|nr:outer membrane beta-barrel protein [Bacteroidota bacterium]
MKQLAFAIVAMLCLTTTFAQSDTIPSNQPDTIKVGNFIIIKKDKKMKEDNDNTQINISINPGDKSYYKKKHSAISTNWLILDLGFANLRDKTDYGSAAANNYLHSNGGAPFTKEDMKLNSGKSSNVNLWFFMQKLNLTQQVLNLKYGLGLEMYNYRYDQNISYHKDPAYIFRDSVDFSKNKLYVGYITIPLMININATPGKRSGFSFSAGVSAGYRVGSKNKQISDERGKQKIRGDFDLNPWRFAYVAEMGIGPVRIYGSYSINALHQEGLVQYPYVFGLRLSNW